MPLRLRIVRRRSRECICLSSFSIKHYVLVFYLFYLKCRLKIVKSIVRDPMSSTAYIKFILSRYQHWHWESLSYSEIRYTSLQPIQIHSVETRPVKISKWVLEFYIERFFETFFIQRRAYCNRRSHFFKKVFIHCLHTQWYVFCSSKW